MHILLMVAVGVELNLVLIAHCFGRCLNPSKMLLTIDSFGPGLIYIVNQLDYEIQSKYELIVRATDSVTGIYSEVPVNINVVDANDCPPEFTLNEYNLTISEATPFGTAVLSVSAVDNDSGKIILASLIFD